MVTSFLNEVKATPGGENILECIQCGMCTGSCPMANEMEYPPRKIIAMIRAGMRDEVLQSNSMWYCLSCYMCTARCPRGVKPTEIAHALESLAESNGYKVRGIRTPHMYRSFVDSMKRNGRVHELGMMVSYYLKVNPLTALKSATVGINMFLRKRLPLLPTKVKNRGNLPEIISKFREIRGEN